MRLRATAVKHEGRRVTAVRQGRTRQVHIPDGPRGWSQRADPPQGNVTGAQRWWFLAVPPNGFSYGWTETVGHPLWGRTVIEHGDVTRGHTWCLYTVHRHCILLPCMTNAA